MKKKTAFRLAAERFAAMMNRGSGCCNELDSQDNYSGARDYFTNLFYPTDEERLEYEVLLYHWMESWEQSNEQNRNDRILALLICEQVWLGENKMERK